MKEFLEQNSKYLIRLRVPRPLQDASKSELVSRVIAQEIIRETAILKKYLDRQEGETSSQ